MERWTNPFTGTEMTVHEVGTCKGNACLIHWPTDHHMRDWYLLFRGDRGIFERICGHGIGHPDPDQLDFWRVTGQSWQAVHGCDGCCHEPEKRAFTDPELADRLGWTNDKENGTQ